MAWCANVACGHDSLPIQSTRHIISWISPRGLTTKGGKLSITSTNFRLAHEQMLQIHVCDKIIKRDCHSKFSRDEEILMYHFFLHLEVPSIRLLSMIIVDNPVIQK